MKSTHTTVGYSAPEHLLVDRTTLVCRKTLHISRLPLGLFQVRDLQLEQKILVGLILAHLSKEIIKLSITLEFNHPSMVLDIVVVR